jgi:tRNA-dihydrouridine synthase
MLAPMQGLTNWALRGLFADWVRPDVLFTEFVRAKNVGGRPLSAVDLREIVAVEQGIPLVVQLIGPDQEALVAAAQAAQAAGATHLNLNLGCPYGRMMSGLTGGGMLQSPELLVTLIPALRKAISGSFSVKIRAGYADPEQLFSLLPLFEDAGVDFLVLHPRTVLQEYSGSADHAITARAVQQTRLPIIANGDINTAAIGCRVLAETGAAGLMLGRGAIADPLLFARLRGTASAEPDPEERGAMYRHYLLELVHRYGALYSGEAQQLGKVKNVLRYIDDPDFKKPLKTLRKAVTLRSFVALIDTFVP